MIYRENLRAICAPDAIFAHSYFVKKCANLTIYKWLEKSSGAESTKCRKYWKNHGKNASLTLTLPAKRGYTFLTSPPIRFRIKMGPRPRKLSPLLGVGLIYFLPIKIMVLGKVKKVNERGLTPFLSYRLLACARGYLEGL
jgi:hypothetical protein